MQEVKCRIVKNFILYIWFLKRVFHIFNGLWREWKILSEQVNDDVPAGSWQSSTPLLSVPLELQHGILLDLDPVPIRTTLSQLKRNDGDGRLIVAKVLKKSKF